MAWRQHKLEPVRGQADGVLLPVVIGHLKPVGAGVVPHQLPRVEHHVVSPVDAHAPAHGSLARWRKHTCSRRAAQAASSAWAGLPTRHTHAPHPEAGCRPARFLSSTRTQAAPPTLDNARVDASAGGATRELLVESHGLLVQHHPLILAIVIQDEVPALAPVVAQYLATVPLPIPVKQQRHLQGRAMS